jgi:hypothetical protein
MIDETVVNVKCNKLTNNFTGLCISGLGPDVVCGPPVVPF